MKNQKEKIAQIVQRDVNILLSSKREINLGTKSVKDKTKYTRKEKYKKSFLD